MLAPVRTAAPATTPISLAEAKAHLRVDHTDDDAKITALVQAATDYFDGWSGILGRALVTQTWRVDLCAWPYCRSLRLPLAPVQSVAVAYSDTANADQTFAGANYGLYVDSLGPFVSLVSGASWPAVYDRPDAVRVTFVAGYGNAAAVPTPIQQAIKLLVEQFYDGTDLQAAISTLVAPYRVAQL